MPEIKNTFVKSSMNKDLDARLLPNGVYRDAKNVSISRSEGSDVGALENVLGNRKLTSLRTNIGYLEDAKNTAKYYAVSGDVVLNGLDVIGYHVDVANDRIFLFLTDYSDSSNDRLSNYAPGDTIGTIQPPGGGFQQSNFLAKGAACYIVQYNVSSNQYRVLLGGNFLNFSKTHPILSTNIIDNMLFWTDNRNQPRKINIDFANNNSYELAVFYNPYYYNEDHISVAKFAPFEPISFLFENPANSAIESGLINASTEYLGSHIINTLSSQTNSGSQFFNLNGSPYTITGNNPDLKQDDKIVFPIQEDLSTPINSELQFTVTSVGTSSVGIAPDTTDQDIVQNAVFEIKRKNPDYDPNYKGDANLLKDKFTRFSYRFKYDDGEYSLMAPFTQAAFIPDQFGHFTGEDETTVLRTGNASFMENVVSKIKLNIKLPELATSMNVRLKVTEIQILAKNSDELAVRVVEDVPVSKLSSNTTSNYVYEYLSSKPIKTLPEADLIRVSDQIPIRALTQEVSGNRLIYGNFVNKHATPDYLEYDISYKEKTNNDFTKEFPNHTVKQNRSYQVGVVLYDRYGRASNVILNDNSTISTTIESKNSTIYTPYKNFGTNSIQYWGDYLEFSLTNPIPSSGKTGYPGLYSSTNPLGYYSYRIVIKQQEQEYYNVYTPGCIGGDIIWDTIAYTKENTQYTITGPGHGNIEFLPSFSNNNKISLLNLFGDNINKVPRELSEVGADDKTFNSTTILYNRVNPRASITSLYSSQSKTKRRGEKVVSIEPFKNLGEWTSTKGKLFPGGNIPNDISSSPPSPTPWYPYYITEPTSGNFQFNFHDIFFNAESNPFIAKIETNFQIGATPTYASKEGIENSWRDLGVFETEPTKSVLDIYYETSSSGLISELNNDIGTNGPFSLRDASGNDSVTGSLQWILSENDAGGSDATLYFQAFTEPDQFNPTGTQCADQNNTMSIVSVVDGAGNDRKTEFELFRENTTSYNFKIKSSILAGALQSLFMFGENASTLESYTFVIRVTANNITNDITLNNFRLINDPPVLSAMYLNGSSQSYDLTSLPILPAQTLLYNGPINTANVSSFEVIRFTAKNGSADTSRDTEQLSATVVDSNNLPHPYLYIDNTRANGTQLANNQFVLHPNANSINQLLTQSGQQLTTYFRVKVYDSNQTSVPAGLTDFNRTITFEK
jgi:hypothetical protein